MNKATKSQRFFTYLIDIIIVSIIINFCVRIFCKLVHFDTSNMNALLESIINEYQKYLQDIVNGGTGDTTMMVNYLTEYLKYYFVNLGFKALFSVIVVLLYLVVLPLFWKKQTIGRCIFKSKVVKKDGTAAGIKELLLREIIGTAILYILFGGVSIFIATLILVIGSSRSLADYIGRTSLISLTEGEVSSNDDSLSFKDDEASFSPEADDEYIDAKFREVPDKETDETESEDTYKIF